MIIRKENSIDFNNIYKFVKNAFKTADVSDGNEQDFINKIRKTDNYLNNLCFVATTNFNIKCNVSVPTELEPNIMALELYKGALSNISGIVDLTLENA